MNRYSSAMIDECLHIEMFQNLKRHLRGQFDRQPELIAAETPLLYNKKEKICEILNGNDDDFMNSNYVPVGSVFYQCPEKTHVLTPYFVRIQIDPLYNKNEKALVRKITKDALEIANQFTKKIKGATVRLMNESDAEEIRSQVSEVGYAIQELQKFIDWKGYRSTTEIFLEEQIGLIDGDSLKILIGGFGPQYFFNFIPKDYAAEAQAQCSYSQMSLDDFLKKARGEEAQDIIKVEQKPYGEEPDEETDLPAIAPISYKELCEIHKNISLLEFYVPIVVEFEQEPATE